MLRHRTSSAPTTNQEEEEEEQQQQQQQQQQSREQPQSKGSSSIPLLASSISATSPVSSKKMKQRQQNSASPPSPNHTRSSRVLPSSRSSPSHWTRTTYKLWSAFRVTALTILVLGSSLHILQCLLLRGQPPAKGIPQDATTTKDASSYRLILTNLGWNHPTPQVGLKFGRTLFSTELYHGIQQQNEYDSNGIAWLQPPPPLPSLHNKWWWWWWWWWPPWLQPSSSSTSSSAPLFTYVFMDVETCFEQIWPHYGGGLTANSDGSGGRSRISSSGGIRRLVADQACPYVQHVLDHSPLFISSSSKNKKNKTRNYSHARLVLFDCGYHGPTPPCFSRSANPQYMDDRVSLVSLSANTRQHWSSTHDIGLLPPAVTLSRLNKSQERAIEQCTTTNNNDDGAPQSDQTATSSSYPRPYLLTFIGNFRHSVRQALAPLHNNKTVLILPRFEREDSSKRHDATTTVAVGDNDAIIQDKYKTILQQSQFAAVPRGDYLYTYRLVELFSAGAIPVIFADDWVLPFHNSVIDWTRMAVILPESRAPHVLDYLSLSNITAAEQCRMRQLGYHYYQTYMKTPSGVIQGIVESLEHLRRRERKER